MPKALKSGKVISLLKKNGFVLKRQKGSHLIFFHPKNHRRVIVPFHNKDLPKGTLHEIIKQAGINLYETF
ncbi:MAG: hypothetical protein A3H02_02720 [Candidatus Niyogibacteria bacterium RIFCSPLOWO2_12_FULL_41_13]|uniref:Toxin HicA n=1 Tax=Candidatus Niyogibacteria bacterium RIFCSPLOWO2_12_FULL_41_13 TaxID=1801726 RepID=A0A1G2F349_9BACT|nr:MAG: hypothetical protein A3H02_02720 [Candidatus Niyogibacteria bacterium RIFCSPLOWO2_12_FULL_41_13]